MAYEQFRRKEGRLGRGAYATITKQGTIRLSHSCYEQYFKEFEWVLFYYDKETNQIGIQPVNKKNVDTYQIRKTKTKSSVVYSISAVSFLKYYGIDFSKVRKYEPTWNKEKELVEIDLNNPL